MIDHVAVPSPKYIHHEQRHHYVHKICQQKEKKKKEKKEKQKKNENDEK